MQEFAERWWKVGLALIVLALVIPGAILAGGDEGDAESDAASELASAPPDTTAPGDEATSASGDGEGQPQDGDGRGKDSSSAGDGNGGSDSATPQTPYGPPGKPVGEVPPGAPPSANEQAVEGTLRNFLVSVSKADGPQACAQLSPEGRKRAEDEVHETAPETQGAPCEGAIVLYQGAYGPKARDPEITDVNVSGTQATAVGPPGRETAEFSKIDSVWLIDNYGWGD